ncbi:hypothetical protein JR782_001012 [Salmonella enterica subsp. enterica serovar Eastbourne]|nr:hypothetical protein [Salmonella enterica subsp. enterica serovar Eastbourne]EHC5906704.1 hypothetical protein [Salmonella enterica subsp. enterica serovar Eastbourne]
MTTQTAVLQGVLTASNGKILPDTSITLKEADSGQIMAITTGSGAAYSVVVPQGTWRVTIQRPGDTPRDIGVLSVNETTKDGDLSALLTALTPSSLDMSVLGFMRGLVDEAERAAGSITLNQAAIDQNLKESRILAQQTKQAAQDVQQTVKTQGAPGKDGVPGKDGMPGKDGKSAWEIWKDNQPAGADTSMTAYLSSMKGSRGGDLPELAGVGSYILGVTNERAESEHLSWGYGFGGYVDGAYIRPGAFLESGNTLIGDSRIPDLPGTWQAMGYCSDIMYQLTLFLRIR